MLQMLIIAACIIVHLGDQVDTAMADSRALGVYLGVLALMALVVQVACWRARVRMDRVGWGYARHMADRAIGLSRVAGVVLHAVAVLMLGELAWIRAHVGNFILIDEALCVLPVIAVFVAGWWSVYPLERRVREALLYRELHESRDVTAYMGRWAFVWARMREGLGITLIPIGLASASLESLDRFGTPALQRLTAGSSLADSASTVHAIASAVVVLCVLAIAPALVRFAWDLVPLPDGRTRGAIASVMNRRRIRVVGPLVWRTGGDSVNAAVLGAVFPFRYMVFTDALLANMPLRQLQAVTAHEIAHIRLHHMPWMMVCVVASVYGLGWVAAVGTWMIGVPQESESATTVLSILMLVPIALLFGLVSRRMEWQADAYAARVLTEVEPHEGMDAIDAEQDHSDKLPVNRMPVTEVRQNEDGSVASDRGPSGVRHITPEAAAAVASALQTVADLNAMSPAARSFRHGSIHTRQRRVLALVGADVLMLPIDREVRRIKWAAIGAIVAGALVQVAAAMI